MKSVKASHPSMAVFDVAVIKGEKKEKKKDNQTGHGSAVVAGLYSFESL